MPRSTSSSSSGAVGLSTSTMTTTTSAGGSGASTSITIEAVMTAVQSTVRDQVDAPLARALPPTIMPVSELSSGNLTTSYQLYAWYPTPNLACLNCYRKIIIVSYFIVS